MVQRSSCPAERSQKLARDVRLVGEGGPMHAGQNHLAITYSDNVAMIT